MEDILTIKQVSQLIGVHPETLRRWDKGGELSAIRIGSRGDRRYRREDITAFISKSDQKRLRVASLFAGCGGLDLGFRGDFNFLGKHYPKHNYEIVYANDLIDAAMQTYRINFKTNHAITGDFTEIVKDPDKIPDCDIILGGFPCQDFSVAGKRRGLEVKRGQLYLSMVELVKHKKPMAFIAENVKGLLNIQAGEVIKIIENDFAQVGYKVSVNLFNSANYGVPESRERVIICGIRKDLELDFTPPAPTHSGKAEDGLRPWVTAKDALQDLESLQEGDAANHFWSKAKHFPGTQGNSKISAHKPGPTMRAEHHGNIEFHYGLNRRLSAREAARIQSFPDDFVFYRSTSDAYRQVGNAVAPVFGWHIAEALMNSLKPINAAGSALQPREAALVGI